MHACKNISLVGIMLLMIVLLMPDMAVAISPAINPTPSVVSGLGSTRSVANSIDSDYFTFPGDLPDTLRVLAIRVHFQPDTLSMTFGDGDFMYDFPDTVNPDGWILDSPPHDKQFFLDQLLAARNYFSKYSNGNLTLAGNDNSDEGGDVYPAGDEQSYLLDYPIWTVNYGNDDHERLNERLVQLFKDSWSVAEQGGLLDELAENGQTIDDYDLFIIFHAGAGNEFDTGFDMTPFDIPSVFISGNDLMEFGGLGSRGVHIGNSYIPSGIILPETQRQLGVDVGMHGTVVAQIGFAIGLPHLYNTENGDAGIGMLGLMDRGFGAYFGTIPIPPSAWSRIFMGWDVPVTVSGFSDIDTVRIGGLHLPDDVFSDNLDTPGNVVRLLRIPINSTEYYLAEARMRDPDDDSLAFGWDRDGRMITFHDDYSWEAEAGFRVAVEYSDYDFDLPASGVLLWHVDDQRIRNRYSRDDLQNSFDYRAIRLEEADGTWDIGNEYPFLTAGDGTEYGYFADAFYRDNEFWREANRPLFRPAFGSNTAPSSVSNDGGFTHITLRHFSDIGDTMSFEISNSWVEDGWPIGFPQILDLSAGDIDGDGVEELVVTGFDSTDNTVFVLDNTGVFIDGFTVSRGLGLIPVADLDGDNDDEIVGLFNHGIIIADFDLDTESLDLTTYLRDGDPWVREFATALAIIDHPDGPVVVAVVDVTDAEETSISALRYSDNDDQYLIDEVFDRNALPESECFLLAAAAGEEGPDVVIWFENTKVAWIDLDAGTVELGWIEEDPEPDPVPGTRVLTGAVAADFDGDGQTEYIGTLEEGRLLYFEFVDGQPVGRSLHVDETLTDLRVLDLDNDGVLEPAYLDTENRQLISVERDGLLSEGSPLDLSVKGGKPLAGEALVIDSDGDGSLEWLTLSEGQGNSLNIVAYDLEDGRVMPGFPLALLDAQIGTVNQLVAADIDDDDNVELIVASNTDDGKVSLIVYNLPGLPGEKELVWSEAGGNPANTRYTSIDLSQSGSRADFAVEDAYCWPNPVLSGDVAHFRYPAITGEVEVVIYDIAGREKLSKAASSQGGLDAEQAEIEVDVSSLPSGVYVARLEVGNEVKLIRFAVVN